MCNNNVKIKSRTAAEIVKDIVDNEAKESAKRIMEREVKNNV